MSILVTGGAGYIGSHTSHVLADRGEALVVLDDLSTGFAAAVPAGAELIVGDVGDRELVERIFTNHAVEAIIHFAASVIVPESVTDPLRYYKNNTANSRTLIEAAVRSGVGKFIFSSTAAVYGNPAAVPVTESALPAPVSPYGTSKLMTEWILRDAVATHDLRAIVLRYFNVAGADPAGRSGQSTRNATHLIKVACEAAVGRRQKLTVYGTDYPTADGTCVRDYIHVTDLARAHLAALDHLRAGGLSDTLNCGYSSGYSVLDVINAVKRVSGVDFPVEYADRRPGDPAAIIADSARLRQLLGWRPQHDRLEAIVADALAWERRLAG